MDVVEMKLTIELSDEDVKALQQFNDVRASVGYITREWSATDRVWLLVAEALEEMK